MRRLIEAIGLAVKRNSNAKSVAERIAKILQPYLGGRHLLGDEQIRPSRSGYQQRILHVAPGGRFSVVALVWLPGQCTPIHNHVAWCVSGVHRGSEEERRYWYERAGYSRLIEVGRTINAEGSVTSLVPPGDIHRVVNGGRETSVSLHVYGADVRKLGSSIEQLFYNRAGKVDVRFNLR